MIEGIRQLLKDYSDHIVLVKYGAYYEMYGDQAIEYSKKLNISLGERASSSKSNPAKIEMLKFNEYQSTKYIYLLVMVMNRSVAIFGRPEQGEDGMPDEVESKKSKKLLDRKLLRIISPGTLTDESFLDRQQCNFLMSLCFPKYSKQLYDASPVGMAWVDVSVGTFHYETTSLANLLTDVARIGPSELLLETYMKPLVEKAKKNTELCDLSKHFLINYQQFPHADDFKNYIHMFEDYDPIDRRKNHHIELEGKSKENSAIMGILEYVNTHLPDNQIALQLPQRKRDKKILKIDNVSRASLELLKALRGNEIEGTLYQSIKRTSSVSGTRLLVEWIKEPLIEARIVRDRQQFVTELVNNPQLLNDLQSLLKASNDPERLLHNFSRGQCQITDIHKMAQDLILFEKVKYIIQKNQQLDSKSSLKKSAVNIMSLSILWEKIYKYIDSEPPTKDSIFSQSHTVSASSYTSLQPLDSLGSQEELKTNILQRFNSWLIYPQASQTLTKLHKLLEDWNVEKKQVELTLCSYYDTLNMKASPKYNKFYGYHLQLNARSAADIDRFKKENPKIILNHTKKTLIINHPDWLKLGENLDAVELKIRREERLIIKRLANMILEQRKTIRMNCKLLDEIDVYCSFAQLALEEGLVKPKVNTGSLTKIEQGRHIMVDQGTKDEFVPNDCCIGSPGKNVCVITGPNMSGKSTFLRQVALITILAQMGSYVPAKSATLGVVDQIFCRVGARDDISKSQSTFLVEMLETSHILRNATNKSLAILDEVGRGTGYLDGLSIASGTLMHISKYNKCRTLYATHFGTALTDVVGRMEYRQQLAISEPSMTNSELDEAVQNLDCEKVCQEGTENFDFFCSGIEIKGKRETPEVFHSGNDFKTIYREDCKFDRKMRKGVCDNSHGLLVAMLSGFPESAVDNAQLALQKIVKRGVSA